MPATFTGLQLLKTELSQAFDLCAVIANVTQIIQHHCWDLRIDLGKIYIYHFFSVPYTFLPTCWLQGDTGQSCNRSVPASVLKGSALASLLTSLLFQCKHNAETFCLPCSAKSTPMDTQELNIGLDPHELLIPRARTNSHCPSSMLKWVIAKAILHLHLYICLVI